MQHTAKHCNTPNHTAIAPHCNPLPHTATHYHLQTESYTAIHCTTLQHATPHCTTLHHTAPHCTTLHHPTTMHHTAPQCNHTTPHCTTLQPTATSATHCNALKHTQHTTTHPYLQSPIRGLLASVMMSSTASALSNLITKPSALAAVPFDLGMPRTPERAYLALARAMVIQALDTVLASPVSH